MRPGLGLEIDNVGLLLDLCQLCRSPPRELLHRGFARPGGSCRQWTTGPFRSLLDRRPRRAEPDLIGQMEMAAAGAWRAGKPRPGNRRQGADRHQPSGRHLRPRRAGRLRLLRAQLLPDRSAPRPAASAALRVAVNRSGARVQQATKGYYEMRSTSLFGKEDKGLALRQAMQRAAGRRSSCRWPPRSAMFASDEGFPVLVLSAGVPACQLQPANAAKTPNLSATAIVRVVRRGALAPAVVLRAPARRAARRGALDAGHVATARRFWR